MGWGDNSKPKGFASLFQELQAGEHEFHLLEGLPVS